MRISIIAAIAENGVIGREGKLPWHLSDDLRRFKRLTMGHTIVMGRRTWESIGRPLPGRRMVVVSRQANYRTDADDVEVATSLDEALGKAATAGDEETFIIGGAELYRESLTRADRMYFTCVLADVAGDTYFPDFDWDDWCLVEAEEHQADANNDHPYSFEVYDRWDPKSDAS
jgi:dihydrofolate reductase